MRKITSADVSYGAYLAGISAGDTVLMHSALSSVGSIEGGADAVIDGITDVLGADGTLAVSTLAIVRDAPFDAATTPTGVGIIAETLRRRPDAVRSLCGTHSIAAIGARARELTGGHENSETVCGDGTPYTKLRDMGGKIALLGVDMNRNTTLHSIETLMHGTYLETIELMRPTYMAEGPERVTFFGFPPGHRDFLRLTPHLRRGGALSEALVGTAVLKVIDVARMFEIGEELLRHDPLFFLCENEACEYCARKRREHFEKTVGGGANV